MLIKLNTYSWTEAWLKLSKFLGSSFDGVSSTKQFILSNHSRVKWINPVTAWLTLQQEQWQYQSNVYGAVILAKSLREFLSSLGSQDKQLVLDNSLPVDCNYLQPPLSFTIIQPKSWFHKENMPSSLSSKLCITMATAGNWSYSLTHMWPLNHCILHKGVVILSVRLYVRPTVTCVLCNKTKQCTADILILHEKAITLVFWHQQWLHDTMEGKDYGQLIRFTLRQIKMETG